MAAIKPIQSNQDFITFDDFIWLPDKTIRTLSIDFMNRPKSKLNFFLMKFYLVLATIAYLYCSYFVWKVVIEMVQAGLPDVPHFLRLINDISYNTVGLMKGINLFWTLKENKSILREFERIYPNSLKLQKIYSTREHYWPKWLRVVIYLYIGSTAFMLFSPLLQALTEYTMDVFRYGYADADFTYHKLYQVDFSFDHRTFWGYIVAYSVDIMTAHLTVFVNICYDIWVIFYCLQLCMHFDYIVKMLEEYGPEKQRKKDDEAFMTKLVQQHLTILNLSSRIQTAFSILALIILLSTSSTLICGGIYVIIQGISRELVEYLAFTYTTVGQYYMICYYGQEIITKSRNVGNAAFNHPWYNGSLRYGKSVLYILMRSQKQIELNALGFIPISMEAFQRVMAGTYRIIALLKTILN